MENLLKVFVSSVIADTRIERETAESVVSKMPIAQPWVFEYTPATEQPVDRNYLQNVEDCDLFILILGKYITEPVLREWAAASLPFPKPVLVFIRNESVREESLLEFIRSLKVKYRGFSGIDEFSGLLLESVCDWLVRSVRAGTDQIEDLRHRFWLQHIACQHSFERLREFEPRTPLELTKDINNRERVLPLMARLPQIRNIHEQIAYAINQHYADIYSGSVAEQEIEVIGHSLLQAALERRGEPFGSMYDAGCGNCAQYRSLMCVHRAIKDDFRYYGQDFNPEWKARFNVHREKGEFIEKVLPDVAEIKCDLVACTHTLHFMETNPIAIYSSVFSFNKLLNIGGLCYLTVPLKDSQPGMLDVLRQAAIDANFSIELCERNRMRHNLSSQPVWNITTYVALLLRKTKNIDLNLWCNLREASRFRGGLDDAEIKREGDIGKDVLRLEANLHGTLIEDNPFVRIFRQTLRVVSSNTVVSSRRAGHNERPVDYVREIRRQIEEVHKVLMSGDNLHSRLEMPCTKYFLALVRWFASEGQGQPTYEVISRLEPVISSVLNSRRDIRVLLDDLTLEAAARLMRNLFEICSYYQIDLRAGIEREFPPAGATLRAVAR